MRCVALSCRRRGERGQIRGRKYSLSPSFHLLSTKSRINGVGQGSEGRPLPDPRPLLASLISALFFSSELSFNSNRREISRPIFWERSLFFFFGPQFSLDQSARGRNSHQFSPISVAISMIPLAHSCPSLWTILWSISCFCLIIYFFSFADHCSIGEELE